tara:strand:+ start:102 stop:977 length:876 start_codon:yes stop_codon:yes gene_type:complete
LPKNPYADALVGLKLEDPIKAFFNFCREREQIRINRKRGLPNPWSKDPIFQKGRFLNVFREDDRGSKSIINFCSGLENDLTKLIHAVFFSRWCNKQETLDSLSYPDLLKLEELNKRLSAKSEWCNKTAYPVESIVWNNVKKNRLETATFLFDDIKQLMTNTILASKGDATRATNEINKLLKMENEFPIFMAVVDIAWFRPDIIEPESHVPTGIGAVAYLDILQSYLKLNNHNETCDKMISLQQEYWPEAKRKFQPIDIEYLSCECRKYYSYVNGTKKFEGKNLFTPKDYIM